MVKITGRFMTWDIVKMMTGIFHGIFLYVKNYRSKAYKFVFVLFPLWSIIMIYYVLSILV